ncbi:hypothetical protein BX596_0003 [Enterobacteriaceae bacterium JKS000233]|nr:hypothetical protein BX596_0003 [Enterobacteriaceae bacterium JKS000233]
MPVAENGAPQHGDALLSGSAGAGSNRIRSDGTTLARILYRRHEWKLSFTSPTLAMGPHSLTTTVTDSAGNVGAPSAPLTFTIDTTAPAAPGGVQLSNDTSGTPVPISSRRGDQ